VFPVWPAFMDRRASSVDEDPPGSEHLPAIPGSIHGSGENRVNQQPATVQIQADLALAILKAELAAAGRVWLLLRLLDQKGQGWLPAGLAHEHLTRKEALYHLCGRRQLRNLLNQGEGIFWSRQPARARSPERIWLKSPTRVAAALGLDRLPNRRVTLPLTALLGGMGQVRAYLYATFHSKRHTPDGDHYSAPISRARLATITQVPPRTQRLYDKAAGVKQRANYAVGDRYSPDNHRERAWQHGRAVFQFFDQRGKQGPPGRRYIAWRLPNSYAIDLRADRPRKRKGVNRRPVGLVTTGAQGNGRSNPGCQRQSLTLFHADGRAAGKAYNRDSCLDAYWPAANCVIPGKSRRPATWHVLTPPPGL